MCVYVKLLQGLVVCVWCELLQAKVKKYHGKGVCHIQSVVAIGCMSALLTVASFTKSVDK